MTPQARQWRRAGEIDPVRFARVQGGRVDGVIATDVECDLFDGLCKDPDVLLRRGEVLKDDRAATVVVLPTGAGEVVLKRFRYPDQMRAARRALRPSRARMAFVAALRLRAFGIAVPEPMAFLERRRLGVGVASWLLARRAPGGDAGAVLADAAASDAQRLRVVDALVSVVARLQSGRIVHGDLKATNFLIDVAALDDASANPVELLDLHAVSRAGTFGASGLRRDQRRFLRNFDSWPELQRRASEMLAQGRLRQA